MANSNNNFQLLSNQKMEDTFVYASIKKVVSDYMSVYDQEFEDEVVYCATSALEEIRVEKETSWFASFTHADGVVDVYPPPFEPVTGYRWEITDQNYYILVKSPIFYSVMYDTGGGSYYITSRVEGEEYSNQEGYYREVYQGTKEECLEYVKLWKENSTVWAVFINRPSGEAFLSEENDLSGNWKGSYYSPFNHHGSYTSREEAEICLQEVLAEFDSK